MKGVYLPSVSCAMGRHWRLLVTITPAPMFVQQWGMTGTWCCECLLHLPFMLAICVCVVLDRHLVVSVGYMFVCAALVFSACCTVAICEVGCLART